MRALVTGARGFCGLHLRTFLEGQGVEVHALSLSDGIGPSSKSRFIEQIKLIKPNYVFHLAGVAQSPVLSEYYEINTCFAATLLQALEEAGFSSCPTLLVGTSAEYGLIENDELPITEEQTARPYSHYGISKLAQTQLGQVAAKQGRPIVLVRPFNIIGPGMPKHIAVQSFATQLAEIRKSGIPSVLNVGNLKSSRDFVDVNDVVQIYWRLIQKSEAYGEVVNICTGHGTELSVLLEKLISFYGVSVEVRTHENKLKAIDVPVHYGSTKKLETLLGSLTQTPVGVTLDRIYQSSL